MQSDDESKLKKPIRGLKSKIKRQQRQLSPSSLQRENSKIPLTSIPIRHLKAMIKKDYLLWIRTWRRMAFEIVFPMAIFVVFSLVRWAVPVESTG